MSYPPNCVGDHDIENNKGTITFCAACYEEMRVMTPAEEALIRAAVAVRRCPEDALTCEAARRLLKAENDAVDALLEAQPEWRTDR